jgi:hypothetical protein
MLKNLSFLFVISIILLSASSVLYGQAIDITSGAVQTFYQDRVPHTDSSGKFRDSFNPDSSFLPIGLYGVTPDAFTALEQSGFNLTFTSFTLEPLTQLPQGSTIRSILWYQQSSPRYPFIPIVGDVNGDGADEIGLYYNYFFYLDNDMDGLIDTLFAAGGDSTDIPLLGDWDGDGYDTPGIYRGSNRTFYLYNGTSGTPTIVSVLGNYGDLPLVGDWDGDGTDGVALYRPSTREFFFYNTLQDPPSHSFVIGNPGDIPISGDWNGDGIDGIGVYRPSTRTFWLYDNVDSLPVWQVVMGNYGDTPLTGNWDGQAGTSIGVYREILQIPNSEMRLFYLDNDLDGVADVGIDLQNPRFQRFKDDHRVLGWQFGDEPLGNALANGMDPDMVLSVLRDLFLFYSPKTSQQLLFVEVPPWSGNMTWWPEYISAMDLGCHDNYPKFLGTQLTSLETIANSVSLQTSVLSESKPSWLVVQAFSQTGGGNFQWEMPTPREAKAMVYTAIIHGATGIVYFTWDSWVSRDGGVVGIGPDPPQVYPQGGTVATPEQLDMARYLWSGIVAVNTELDSMAPVVLSKTSNGHYSVFVDDTTHMPYPIRCLLKNGQNCKYLLTVNICSDPLNVRYQFDDTIPGPVSVLFENGRTISVQSNGFIDYYEGFDVHIYLIP